MGKCIVFCFENGSYGPKSIRRGMFVLQKHFVLRWLDMMLPQVFGPRPLLLLAAWTFDMKTVLILSDVNDNNHYQWSIIIIVIIIVH